MLVGRYVKSRLKQALNHYRFLLPFSIHRVKTPYRSEFVNYSSANSVGKGSSLKNHRTTVIAAVGLAATGALAYVYRTQISKEEAEVVVEEHQVDDIYFVDEHLQENLDLLQKYGPIPYLIIGAGTASFAAFRAIRANDETSKIVVIGEEPFYPYMRPPLSKEMWYDEKSHSEGVDIFTFKQYNGRERSIFFQPEDFYRSVKDLFESKNGGVAIIRGIKAIRIDPTSQIVDLENGETISYKKCLIATGGKPKNLAVFETSDELKQHVTLFRNINDFRKLDKVSRSAKSVTIVGGGFLGSELACALGTQSLTSGLKVIQVFPENGIMAKVLPEYLSEWATKKVCALGVDVIPKVTVTKVLPSDKKMKLLLSNGKNIVTDHIVVAVGLQPNIELASTSGLEIDEKQGGFLVNSELEARKNLYVAGDVASFFDGKLGRRRIEHHDHAIVSGRLAGENMTGRAKPYHHQSMFWSDLGPDIGYEAIGIVDSSLETVGIFLRVVEKDGLKSLVEATDKGIYSETDETRKLENLSHSAKVDDEFKEGIIFYLRDKVIVGIMLWNIFAKIPLARKVINQAKPCEDLAEVAKLFYSNNEAEQ